MLPKPHFGGNKKLLKLLDIMSSKPYVLIVTLGHGNEPVRQMFTHILHKTHSLACDYSSLLPCLHTLWYNNMGCLPLVFKKKEAHCTPMGVITSASHSREEIGTPVRLMCGQVASFGRGHCYTSTVYWCFASKLKAPRNFYWMSNMFLWVEIFIFFVCYHVVPKRHSQLDYELNGW